MDTLLFFVFAFFSVFLSIKLSLYADDLSKNSSVSNGIIGGVLLAGVTSLPEFVTCVSAVKLGNPSLSLGDILGSNVFNIFVICFFDFIFIKKTIFKKTNMKNHKLTYLISIFIYIVMLLFIMNIFNFSIFSMGIPSLVIIVIYCYYLFSVSKNNEDEVVLRKKTDKFLVLKLIITAILMVISSILLTFTVNNIAIMHPNFSSSLIGAILLGITTSLPEVVTFYTLVSIDSYDLALSNIIGSNLFNLLVLSVGDFFVKESIYNYSDGKTLILLLMALFFTMVNFYQNKRAHNKSKFLYIIPSFLIVLLYLLFWASNFIF